jgi:GNAT superfamily N-acetyltransferase
MPQLIELATPGDAAAIADIRIRAAEDLTDRFGPGHWSSLASERSVLAGMRIARILVARSGANPIGTLTLQTRKPWAIDVSYFTECRKPWYITNMAVDPGQQHNGVGRSLMDAAERFVRGWGGDAIRLDAYDDPAGAGAFYEKCGYVERGRVVFRVVPLVYYEKRLSDERRAMSDGRRDDE